MKVSDFVVRFLAARGVTHVFELSGGMITHLLDSAARNGAPKLVSMPHEQAAGFAAEGMARMTGVPGVAFATSGPGATNLLTAIGSCYFDSVPAVFITGQVNRSEIRDRDQKCRQLGFQEMDIVSIAAPITKAAFRALHPEAVGMDLYRAFSLAMSGRRGPVLLDIPMDVQQAEVEGLESWLQAPPIGEVTPKPKIDPAAVLAPFLTALGKRPLVLVGGGVRGSGAHGSVHRLLSALWIPVVHSLMGVDVLNTDHPLNVGLIGSYGNRWANAALAEADTVLVLGSRLDVRQTGADVAAFERGKKIIHVDVDPGELGNHLSDAIPVKSDLGAFAEAALLLSSRPVGGFGCNTFEWRERIATLRAAWPAEAENDLPANEINPNALMRSISRFAIDAGAAAYVVDVGQHQMWAAQSLLIDRQRFITSGGMGAMGFAIPAAVGVALATKRPVVVIAGDGGAQLNLSVLHTIAKLRLPIKIVVANNFGHGMVRQFQASYFEGRSVSTDLTPPSFVEVARAYGIEAWGCTGSWALARELTWLWSKPDAPALLEVAIPAGAHALPKIAFGRGLAEMDPPKPLP